MDDVFADSLDDAARIGIMGGTFDPIHHGHLVAASEVADRFQLDEVVFVPTGNPWQKAGRTITAAEDRYLMTVIATASNPRFSVSRVDIDRGGPTYTMDTLRDLREQFRHEARVQHGDAFAHFAVFGQGAAGLAHEPHRGARGGAAVGRLEQWCVGEVASGHGTQAYRRRP